MLPRWQKIVCGGMIAFLVYTLAGFLAVPAVGRQIAVTQLQKHLQRNVQIEKIRFNPYTLSGRIQNFTLFGPDRKTAFVAFRELYFNLQSISLIKLAPVLKELRLEAPTVNLALAPGGRWNFADLLPTPAAAGDPPAEDGEHDPFRFSLNNIQIRDGRIHFQDGERNKAHVIEAINIDLPFLSNLETAIDIFTAPQFAATVNGTPLALKGSTKPFADSLETALDIELRAIDLAAYMPYLPPDAPIAIQSGRLDVKLHFAYVNHADGSIGLRSAGTLNLNDLALADPAGHPLVAFEQLHIDIGNLEPLTGIVRFNDITLKKPTFTITRLPTDRLVRTSESVALAERFRQIKLEPPDIRLNRLQIEDARLVLRDLKSPAPNGGRAPADNVMLSIPKFEIDRARISIPEQKVEVAAVTSADGRLELRRLADGVLNLDVFLPPSAPASSGETPAAPGRDWQVEVEKLDIGGYALQGVNLIPGDPATFAIEGLQLAAVNLTNVPGVTNRLDLACRINTTGQLDTHTEWQLAPLAMDTRIELQSLDLAALYPLFKPYMNAVLADGQLSIDGNLRLTAAADEAPGLATRFQGSAGLRALRILDRQKAQPQLTWESLQLDDIDAGYRPTFVNIRAITLEKPTGLIAIDREAPVDPEDGSEAPPGSRPTGEMAPADTAASDASEPPLAIAVERIFVQDGALRFADNSFSPGFTATLDGVEARILKLSTAADQPAEILLAGKMNNLAPLEIAGRINPRPDNLMVDLKISLQQMDLTATSPYTARFVSRKIRRGKLSADLDYKVAANKLNAQNGIRIDQFDFGETVRSEEALDLPVDLAVALLRDRNGLIRINLPVQGDMNDPDFSIGGIVLQAFLNLIVKAAASPFSLIGAMVGGEDLSHLEFEAGQSLLTPATAAKLEDLANVLYERPGLRLEISGFADPARDRPALSEIAFQNKLRTQKILVLTKRQAPPDNPEAVTITTEEYPLYLQAAYEAESFAKPRNLLGFAKKLPPEEAERLLRENIEIDGAQLEALAQERARTVQDHLLASGRIEAERIFLVKPNNVLAPEALTGIPLSRVELGLK
jgi:hypothetical protein